MTETVRYAIVGTGAMGLEHMRNIALIEDAEVVAIVEPNEAPRGWAQRVAGETGITLKDAQIFSSCEALVSAHEQRDLVDALVIATPNYTHADVLEPVWQTDLHVMVEKPMCTTLSDCFALEERAQNHRGVVWVGMEYRYMPPVARLIEGGAPGNRRIVAHGVHPGTPGSPFWSR